MFLSGTFLVVPPVHQHIRAARARKSAYMYVYVCMYT